jgi:MOSC domain-containing protein YiiM
MTHSPSILSIQVGAIQTMPPAEPGGEAWRSAILKGRVDGPVWARALGLDGDAQAETRHHGGESQAINVYPSEHYDYWRETPALASMRGGAFGENFTTAGLDERTVCLGDVFRAGEALVEISQPRGPCYKLNRRWQYPDLQRRAEDTYRFGWYFRVREEGRVQAGDALVLIERPLPEWSIARVWDVTKSPLDTPEQITAAEALRDLPVLGKNWRRSLDKMLQRA